MRVNGRRNNLALGLEEEHVLKVKIRKGEYVDWKFMKSLDW